MQSKISGSAVASNAPKKLLSMVIIAAGLFLSTPAWAQITEILTVCQLAPGTPGVSCICRSSQTAGNLNLIANGEIFCSILGWTRNYPIVNLSACPFRVNRFRPEPNGCGSVASGTGWVGQKFLGRVPLDIYVCNPHDTCYSDCETDKQTCDSQWLVNLGAVCRNYFPGNDAGNLRLAEKCIGRGMLYHTAFVLRGQDSWEAAQKEACQCGPDIPCMGGQAVPNANAPHDNPLDGPIGPGAPPEFGCSPGDDFC